MPIIILSPLVFSLISTSFLILWLDIRHIRNTVWSRFQICRPPGEVVCLSQGWAWIWIPNGDPGYGIHGCFVPSVLSLLGIMVTANCIFLHKWSSESVRRPLSKYEYRKCCDVGLKMLKNENKIEILSVYLLYSYSGIVDGWIISHTTIWLVSTWPLGFRIVHGSMTATSNFPETFLVGVLVYQ